MATITATKTRRKPLPYAASRLLRDALKYNAEAIDTLRQMTDRPMNSEERYRLLAKAVDRLHLSSKALREVKELAPDNEVA